LLSIIGIARGGPEGPRPPANEKKNVKASLVNLTLNMRYKNDKKNIKFVITRFVFFQAQNPPKCVFGRRSAPDPAGGAYDDPPDPLVGWGAGYPSPFPFPLNAFSVSNSALRFSGPPQHKILATPVLSIVPSYGWRNISVCNHFNLASSTLLGRVRTIPKEAPNTQ